MGGNGSPSGRQEMENQQTAKIPARPEAAALQSPPVESSVPDLTARTQTDPIPRRRLCQGHMPMSQGLLIVAASIRQPDWVWEGARDLWSVSPGMENSGSRDLLSCFPRFPKQVGYVWPPLPLSHLPSIQP